LGLKSSHLPHALLRGSKWSEINRATRKQQGPCLQRFNRLGVHLQCMLQAGAAATQSRELLILTNTQVTS
jgi:hypothetical protein